jgi:membrane fusion protein (multidrug efflux system)
MENTQPAQPAKSNGKRRAVLGTLAAIFILAAAGYGLYYFLVLSHQESTDDAYVNGNQVPLVSQVAGTVTQIVADETQLVQAGQPLVKLDAADSEVALQQSRAALGETVRQIRGQFDTVAQLNAAVAQHKAELARAQDDLARRKAALADKSVSQEEYEHAANAVEVARAAVTAAERQAAAQLAMVADTTVASHPAVQKAEAVLRQAYLNSARNALPSPVTGYVAKRSVQLGQRVTPGNPLMVVVPLDQLWVDANFKESQLGSLRIGQPVKLIADIYGGHIEYHGKVIGLGAGTGGAFALLPPQNASGNWIKVVQRVPVRIALDREELRKYPLRLGLSMTATVDTHDRGGDVLAAAPAQQPAYTTTAYDAMLADADRVVADVVKANLNAGKPAR